MLGLINIVPVPVHPQCEVCSQTSAHKHGCDLDADTCNHDIVSDIDQIGRLGRRDTTTCGLSKDTHDVAADEDPSVEMRLKLRVFRSVMQYQVFEREIHARRHEGRTQDQTYNLDLEARLRPGVVVHDDAASISYTLA